MDAVCLQGKRPDVPDHAGPAPLLQLMRRCWAPDMDDRPTFEEIVEELEKIKGK